MDDKVFSLSELCELDYLITRLENIADDLDFCTNNDVENISQKSQDKFREYGQDNSKLLENNRNFSIMNTSNENATFSLSFDTHSIAQQQGILHNILSSGCLVGVRPYASEAKEEDIVNYPTRSGICEPVCESSKMNVISESDYTELSIPDYIQKLSHLYEQDEPQSFNSTRSGICEPVCETSQVNVISESDYTELSIPDYIRKLSLLYDQDEPQSFNSFSAASSDEYIGPSDDNKRDALFNTDTCIPESRENNNNKGNLLGSTNIPLLKGYSGNFGFAHVQKCEDNNKRPQIQSSEVDSHVNGNKDNEFVNNDEPPLSVNDADPLGMDAKAQWYTKKRRAACQICGRSFYRKDYIVAHYRYHTGEKPYACNRCGKRFAQKCDLTRHLRTHTGEKPYKCSICGKTFANSNNRSRHYKMNHNKK